jgi:hypothetical protein
VGLHGGLTDEQVGRDLGVRPARRDQPQSRTRTMPAPLAWLLATSLALLIRPGRGPAHGDEFPGSGRSVPTTATSDS